MGQKRKSPTLQGSVNQICFAVLFGCATPLLKDMLCRFTAAQFGRSVEDIQKRVEITLEHIAAGDADVLPEPF